MFAMIILVSPGSSDSYARCAKASEQSSKLIVNWGFGVTIPPLGDAGVDRVDPRLLLSSGQWAR
jgi:hypothetical protein